ncbi:MAG: citrate/2-methylcitrate synthase [Candidatus Latescibacterota bacterium]
MSTSSQPEARAPVRGLENVVAGQTRISHVDGVNGLLIYNGYDVHDLARQASFGEVVFLSWYSRLPNRRELEQFRARLVSEMRLPSQVIKMIELAPRGAHPMDLLRTAVSALSMFDPDSGDLSAEANERKMIRLLAQVMTIIADMHRVRHQRAVLSPDPTLRIGDNFLYMFRGRAPDPEEAEAFDHLLLLHLDHGFNASTFAARVTASTLSDMHAALTSALGTLKGALHGGANEKVLQMLHQIENVDMVESYIEGMLNDGQRIMGFGHRVYKTEDPRARLLREWSERLCHRADMSHLYEISHRIEQVVLDKKGIYPNVDFYSATVQHALGIPKEYFTAVFAAARTAGWLAHVVEQYADNRLIRPTSNYIGGWGRQVVPLDQRG